MARNPLQREIDADPFAQGIDPIPKGVPLEAPHLDIWVADKGLGMEMVQGGPASATHHDPLVSS